MLAAIRGAEQRCRPGARKDNVGGGRSKGGGPEGGLVHGRGQPLPMLAAVLAAVHAAVRATVHDTSVTGMHRQGAHGAFAIKAVADPQPGVSTIAAAPDALSKGAYTDRGILRHGLSPSVTHAYPETPRAFRTASPIGTKGFSSGVVARNIRLWVMATASRVSGSAHPIDPPAPGWPKVRGFLPAATIDRGGAAP